MTDKQVTLHVEAAYGLKVPASAAYSSQEARLGLSIDFPATGEFDAIRDRADEMTAVLVAQLKLAVFAQLGVGVIEAEDGTLLPDLSGLEAPKAAAKGNSNGYSKPASSNSGGGAPQQRTPRKVDPSDIPIYNVTINGTQIEVQDLRDLKSNGTYKNTAPDFRVDGDGYWLVDKQGKLNPKAVALAEAVAPFVPFESGDAEKEEVAVW